MRGVALLALFISMSTVGVARAFARTGFVPSVGSKVAAISQQRLLSLRGRVRPPVSAMRIVQRSGAARLVPLGDRLQFTAAGLMQNGVSSPLLLSSPRFGVPASVACRSASTDSPVEAESVTEEKPAVKKRVVSGVQVLGSLIHRS